MIIRYKGIRDVANLFNGVSTDKIIRDQQNPKVLLMVITSNMKAKETKKKMYHLKNILIWSEDI